jgi:hypothetical protein
VPKQLLRRNGIESKLVKETQKPRFAGLEVPRDVKTVPDLNRATDKLVTARPFHSVDTKIGAADIGPVSGWLGRLRLCGESKNQILSDQLSATDTDD